MYRERRWKKVIREALLELRAWRETAQLTLFEHEESGRVTFLITEWKEVFLELGDNMSLLQSLKESQYFKPFAAEAGQYEAEMGLLDRARPPPGGPLSSARKGAGWVGGEGGHACCWKTEKKWCLSPEEKIN